MKTDTRVFITAKHIREMFGNPSLTTIWRWVREGLIPQPVKIGQKRLWDAQEVEIYMARLRAARNVEG